MDLDGTFHDFGIRRVAASTTRVTPAGHRGTEAQAAVNPDDTSTPIWVAVAATSLIVGAALLLANRRGQSG